MLTTLHKIRRATSSTPCGFCVTILPMGFKNISIKKTLAHLPQEKQDDVQKIVERILTFIDPVMIILFGSYARGDWKEESDLEPDRKSGHASDYDILVITDRKSIATNTSLTANLNDSCKKLELTAHPKIISHYLKYVNERLAKGQYFFTDIVKEGFLVYDSGKHTLATPIELTPAEQKQIAEENFNDSFVKAMQFYANYEFNIEKTWYKLAAFQLNQSAEACFKTVLLVCTSYIPNEHHLNVLGEHCAKYGHDLLAAFPTETPQQRELFELLDYAYIGARYDRDYKITREELEYLAERVQELQKITKDVCKAKIESF